MSRPPPGTGCGTLSIWTRLETYRYCSQLQPIFVPELYSKTPTPRDTGYIRRINRNVRWCIPHTLCSAPAAFKRRAVHTSPSLWALHSQRVSCTPTEKGRRSYWKQQTSPADPFARFRLLLIVGIVTAFVPCKASTAAIRCAGQLFRD